MSTLPAYLSHSLKHFIGYFDRDDVIEMIVNQPGEVWLETRAGFEQVADANLSLQVLTDFATNLATYSGQRFDPVDQPFLATTIPGYGYRLQVVGGSLVASEFILAIRMGSGREFALEDFLDGVAAQQVIAAVVTGRTVLVAGGTSTGKTSFVNTLLKHVPRELRLVVIEDAMELNPMNANVVRFVKSRTSTDRAQITYKDIINCCVRLRPDRLVLGELDIENTAAFMRLLNTGHGGCITTVHAESGENALAAVTQNLRLGGMAVEGAVDPMVRQLIPLVVHLSRGMGERKITGKIYANGGNSLV